MVQNTYLLSINIIETLNEKGEYNGYLLPLVNKNEPNIEEIDQVYIAACAAKDIKGPHMHKGTKTDRFYCIGGKMAIVCRNEETKQICEYVLEAFDNQLLIIPPWNSHAMVALDNEQSFILSMPTEGYHPDKPYNQIETEFVGYDWRKWQ